MYVVCTHKNHLDEAILMSTDNKLFISEKIKKMTILCLLTWLYIPPSLA